MEPEMGWWDWAGIVMGVVGVVAFVMAIQPFMQFCLGRPKLEVEFATSETEDGRLLDCGLCSPQVCGILRKIGIRRDSIEGLSVSASIVDARTKKTMKHEDFAALIDAEGKGLNVVDIAAPGAMVMVYVALMRKGAGKAVTSLRMLEGEMGLPPGEYICHLSIKSASVADELRRTFLVGSQPHELYWEQGSS